MNSHDELVYNDSNVKKACINLGRLNKFIDSCLIKTELEYINICQNIGTTNGNTDTPSDFLINLLIDCFEFIGTINFSWTNKIISCLLCGLVDTWIYTLPTSLQNDFNNVWAGIKQAYDEVKLTINKWINNLNSIIWSTPIICPKTNSVVSISQLSSIDYLPLPDTTEFNSGATGVAKQSKYLINKILVPTRWQYNDTGNDNWWNCYYTIRKSSYSYDGPFYDGLTAQYLFGSYTAFPDIDVVKFQTDANHYIYFSKENTRKYVHNWFSNNKLYKGTKYIRWNLTNKIDGKPAPDSFINYLFTDGPGGNSANGITTCDDVFNNWNLTKQMNM